MKFKVRITVIVLSILAVATAYTLYDLNGESFDLTDRQMLLIVTDSMDGDVDEFSIDSFPKNTMIMVQKMDPEQVKQEIRIGDVLSFKQGGYLNHHRVINIDLENGYIETKGDNAPMSESVPLGDVHGKVVGTNHLLGMLSSFAQHNVWLIVFILFVITAVDYTRGVLKKDKQTQEKAITDEYDK